MAAERKVTVTLLEGEQFEVEPTGGQDSALYARQLLENGATRKYENGAFTIYPASQVRSVTVGKRPKPKTSTQQMGVL